VWSCTTLCHHTDCVVGHLFGHLSVVGHHTDCGHLTECGRVTTLSVAASLSVAVRTCARNAEICVYSRLHSPKLIRRLTLCCLRSLISRAASSRLAQCVPRPRARTACRSATAAPPSDGAACKLMLHIARQHNNTRNGACGRIST
jgi:hypothetical protein